MNQFEEIKVLGGGGFGTVTKCREIKTGEIVAIKKMKQKFSSFEECLQLKEVKSLRKIKHENVCRLLQVFRENESLYLVFECLGETLFKTIANRNGIPFEESEIRYILNELLSGLAVVHKQGFFHRDIKPDNLLWSDTGRLKISDFGLAREIRSKPPYTNYVGTRWYRAPEIILHHPFYNSPVDIWSVGCIAAELFMLKPLFPGTSESDQFFKILNILGTPTSSEWPDFSKLAQKRGLHPTMSSGVDLASLMPDASQDAIDFIKQCLEYDPKNRPSASRLLQHRFLQGVKTVPKIGAASKSVTATRTLSNLPEKQQSPKQINVAQPYQGTVSIPNFNQVPTIQQQSDFYEKKDGSKTPLKNQKRLIYQEIAPSPRSKYYYPIKTQLV